MFRKRGDLLPKRSKQTDDTIAALALTLIDLRAHFEAQLRTVTRAEQGLFRCRGANDAATFDAAADALRAEVRVISVNRRTADAVLDQVIADTRELKFAG